MTKFRSNFVSVEGTPSWDVQSKTSGNCQYQILNPLQQLKCVWKVMQMVWTWLRCLGPETTFQGSHNSSPKNRVTQTSRNRSAYFIIRLFWDILSVRCDNKPLPWEYHLFKMDAGKFGLKLVNGRWAREVIVLTLILRQNKNNEPCAKRTKLQKV